MSRRRKVLLAANALVLVALAWALVARAGRLEAQAASDHAPANLSASVDAASSLGGTEEAAAARRDPDAAGAGSVDRAAGTPSAAGRSPGGPASAGATQTGEDREISLGRRLDEALERDLEQLVKEAQREAESASKGRVRAADCTVSVVVADLVSGQVVADLEGRRALRPASNMKLVTSAAALVLLGPGGAFRTPFEATGPIEAGVLEGDLVLRAGGDPLAAVDEKGLSTGAVEPWFEPLIEGLSSRGVRRIEGDLVLDEGTFPDPAPGPAWPDPSQRWQEYCALAGGFSANGGCLAATVWPTRPGQPARVRVDPAAHGLEPVYDVETVARGSPLVVALEARAGRCLVRGKIPADVRVWSDDFAHPDPVQLFGETARDELARAGIELAGGVRRQRDAPAATRLGEILTPIRSVLPAIDAHSHNGVADQLFLATGLQVTGAGTRAGGAQATAWALERLGVPTAGLVQVDGSGLSRDDRVTAEQMVALLAAVRGLRDGSFELLRDSLAVAGERGTLADRMRAGPARGRVFAKSGFIAGTSALSGYVCAPGRELAFSILVEYPRYGGLNTRVWKPMQDRICVRLAGGEESR